MSGAFRVVATPIGNLDDLSTRARSTLCEADYVLAEDTRRARILLEHIQSGAKVLSCHQHNELARVNWVRDALAEDKSIALISDAGAPSISDPGGRLVAELAASACPVEVIPGPSAPIAALMGAGIAATRFVFLGFLPRKNGARKTLLERVPSEFGVVLFESPHRVEGTLAALHEVFGGRKVAVARELTKRFETFHRGVLGSPLDPPLIARGEIVIVVESGEAKGIEQGPTLDRESILDAIMAEEGCKPRERAKRLAKELQLSTREAYALVQNYEASLEASESGTKPVVAAAGVERGDTETAPRTSPSLSESLRYIRNRISVSADARHTAQTAMWRAACAMAEAEHLAAAPSAVDGNHPAGDPNERGPTENGPLEQAIEILRGLLERNTSLPAPVELRESVTTLLQACLAMEALEDALGLVSEGTESDTDG